MNLTLGSGAVCIASIYDGKNKSIYPTTISRILSRFLLLGVISCQKMDVQILDARSYFDVILCYIVGSEQKYLLELWAQSFTSLKADLLQDIN